MEDIKKKMGETITSEFSKQGIPAIEKYKLLRKIQNEDEEKEVKKHYLDYLKNKNDASEIYVLIRSKKHSKNQIRAKLRTYLKDSDELNKFLQAILDAKTSKKEESKEATSAGGSSGAFIGPLSGSEEKIDNKNIPTVREAKEYCGSCDRVKSKCVCDKPKKVETKEATSSSSSGQFSQPAIWAKSMSKKNWKGASTKYMPGAKRVQVKKKCKKFPYCNQGDINALKIFESGSVQNAIDSVSSGYGYNKDYISEIVFREIRKRQN